MWSVETANELIFSHQCENLLFKSYLTCMMHICMANFFISYFGSQVELNEIESSCEEYPLTRAFCHLTSTLVESSLPVNLGAGLRVPGFQPYLNFLRDSVFLPFPTRAYHRPAEKVKCCVAFSWCLHKAETCSSRMHVCSLNYTNHCSCVFLCLVFFCHLSVGGC